MQCNTIFKSLNHTPMASPLLPTLLLLFSSIFSTSHSSPTPDYADALYKSLLFFQAQRSGHLPPSQEAKWRSSSGLTDGYNQNVDLSGGYYDAGDNVKFNFPMAYTTTMLSWSVLEYGGGMGEGALKEARDAIKWAADYLLNCTTHLPDRLYVGVTNPLVDHPCWLRPEDMPANQPVFFVSPDTPGSDVAGEIAAALAAASIVFRRLSRGYSSALLAAAVKSMNFAKEHLGSYSDGPLHSVTCPFYCSYSGYQDELRWGAAWLLRATNKVEFYNMVKSFRGAGDTDLFSWDRKDAGSWVLLSRRAILDKDTNFMEDQSKAEQFICKILPTSPMSTTSYTGGGLMYKLPDNNLQYVTSITFLLTTYAKYMRARNIAFSCGGVQVTSGTLKALAKRQVDYILGVNPLGMSYMVGFGRVFPKRIHHRAASIPSLADHPQSIECGDGFHYYYSGKPNPNIHVGAVVGGPDRNDGFSDDRADYRHTEPTTYINAALVGPLAYFSKSRS